MPYHPASTTSFPNAMSHHLLRDLRTLAVCNIDASITSKKESIGKNSGAQLFYTLHTALNDLVYVSEICTAYNQAPFGAISLPDLDGRHYKVRVCIWMKQTEWILFYRLKIDMRNLMEVGRTYDCTMFGPNTLVWCLNDTWWCLSKDIHNVPDARTLSWSRPRMSKRSYTLDDIRQLTSLYIGVQEFHDTKQRLIEQINGMSQLGYLEVRRLKFDLHSLHRYIVKQNGANDALHQDVYTKKVHIGRSARIIEDFPHFREICAERLAIAEAQIDPLRESLAASIYPNMIESLRVIGQVLCDAYPIKPINGHFSICGIEFPLSMREVLDACYYSEPHMCEPINAALAYIVLLMQVIADIMRVAVKYAMKQGPEGAFIAADTETFPLFYCVDTLQKFALYEHPGRTFSICNAPFEQGLALLSRNLAGIIAAITDLYAQYYHDGAANHRIANNIPADCWDNLLWNLHYLLLFITAPTRNGSKTSMH